MRGIAPPAIVTSVKAIRYYRYGSPDVLRFEDTDMPAVGDDDVLVRVRAASVNPLDWHFMRGEPYLVRLMAGLSRPRAGTGRLGADMAGSVEAVGKNVTEAGKVTPVIDRTYPLAEAAEAIRYLETGHARGKVAITV
jgi:NADPH:quinone reductase-like Zn-dependent oxidoreductase